MAFDYAKANKEGQARFVAKKKQQGYGKLSIWVKLENRDTVREAAKRLAAELDTAKLEKKFEPLFAHPSDTQPEQV